VPSDPLLQDNQIAQLSLVNERLKEVELELEILESKNAALETELARIKQRQGEGLKQPHARLDAPPLDQQRIVAGVFRNRSQVRYCPLATVFTPLARTHAAESKSR
jgi:hypothetical protein